MVYTSPQYSVEESVHENILNKHLQSFTNFILNV